MIELQTSVPPSTAGWSRIFTAILEGNEELANLNYIQNRPKFSEQSLSIYEQLINALVAAGANGVRHAWLILGEIFHDDDEVASINSMRLIRISTNLVTKTEWDDRAHRNGLRDYSVGVVLKHLAQGASISEIREMLAAILRTAPENDGYIPRDQLKYASAFFPNNTTEALDAIWEAVGRQERTSLKYSMDGFGRAPHAFKLKMSTELLISWCSQSPAERFPFASEICDLFEQDEAIGRLAITDQALSVLNLAPDKQKIIQNYVERFRPSTWSGPLSEILEPRVELFDDLKGDPALQELIADAEQKFRNDIIECRRFDASREKAEAQSFE